MTGLDGAFEYSSDREQYSVGYVFCMPRRAGIIWKSSKSFDKFIRSPLMLVLCRDQDD